MYHLCLHIIQIWDKRNIGHIDEGNVPIHSLSLPLQADTLVYCDMNTIHYSHFQGKPFHSIPVRYSFVFQVDFISTGEPVSFQQSRHFSFNIFYPFSLFFRCKSDSYAWRDL